MSDGESVASLFGLLSDEDRIDILRGIAQVKQQRDVSAKEPGTVQTSEIESQVDFDDQKCLTEHLEALTGPILRRHDGQYSLTWTGVKLLEVILGATDAPSIEFDSRSVSGRCPVCGTADLVANVCEQSLYITCSACERTAGRYPISVGQAHSWRRRTLLQKVKQRQIVINQQLERSNCPGCGGKITTTITEVPTKTHESPADSFRVHDTCNVCHRQYSGPLPIRAAYHPASIFFHREHDVRILTKAPWELYRYLATERWTMSRVDYDGTEYEVLIRCNSDVLRCVLDTTATVRRTERL